MRNKLNDICPAVGSLRYVSI